MNALINIGCYVTYALFAVALLVLVFFSIKQFVASIAKSKTTLYALIAIVAIFAVSYMCASSNDVSDALLEKNEISAVSSKFIGSGVLMVYILFAISLGTLVVWEAVRAIKK